MPTSTSHENSPAGSELYELSNSFAITGKDQVRLTLPTGENEPTVLFEEYLLPPGIGIKTGEIRTMRQVSRVGATMARIGLGKRGGEYLDRPSFVSKIDELKDLSFALTAPRQFIGVTNDRFASLQTPIILPSKTIQVSKIPPPGLAPYIPIRYVENFAYRTALSNQPAGYELLDEADVYDPRDFPNPAEAVATINSLITTIRNHATRIVSKDLHN